MSSPASNEAVIEELTKDLESNLIDTDISKSESPSSSSALTNEVPDPDKDEDSDNDSHKSEEDAEDIELRLKETEDSLTEDEKEQKRAQADIIKSNGNDNFKEGNYEKSIEYYTKGLGICPLAFPKDRATLYCNRAASKMKLTRNKDAIKDCIKAIEYDPTYLKAYFRRAQCYEATESLDESLADYKKVLELDPQHAEARKSIHRLPPLIEERNERMKTEMMSKLKDLGNLVLRPFGLSTDNFKLTQDPETKGYSVNFQQNK